MRPREGEEDIRTPELPNIPNRPTKRQEEDTIPEKSEDLRLQIVRGIVGGDHMLAYNALEKIREEDLSAFFELTSNAIEECDDEVMKIEFIHLGQQTLEEEAANLRGEELKALIKFLQAAGNTYWQMQVFETALKLFEDAIYFLQSLVPKSEETMKLLLRVIKYREEIRQFHLASRDSLLGLSIATQLGNEGWKEAFGVHVLRNNLETIKIYTLSAQSLIWDGFEKLAKNNIVRAITAVSDILRTGEVPDVIRPLLTEVTEVFSSIRHLTEEDNETLNLLLRLRNSKQLKESAEEIHKALNLYCSMAYQPRLYTLLICSSSGQLAYSKVFDKNAVQGSEELYSGLFTALSLAMSDALGSGQQSYSVEYGGRQVLMEASENFFAYLICERDTPELHHKLRAILDPAEKEFSHMNQYLVASGKAMRALFGPRVEEAFGEL